LFFGLPVAGGVRAKRIRHPMVADFGFGAATIPMQNSLITIITIPVQAGITAAVLMVVAAATAGIEPRTTRTTRTRIDAAGFPAQTSPSGKSLCQ
jgi:hypothetical protein